MNDNFILRLNVQTLKVFFYVRSGEKVEDRWGELTYASILRL